jgi:hypothetical protein
LPVVSNLYCRLLGWRGNYRQGIWKISRWKETMKKKKTLWMRMVWPKCIQSISQGLHDLKSSAASFLSGFAFEVLSCNICKRKKKGVVQPFQHLLLCSDLFSHMLSDIVLISLNKIMCLYMHMKFMFYSDSPGST